MVYQGSKNRLAKYLVPIIQGYIDANGIRTYIEPMVGGANLIDKINCEKKIGSDKNEILISLLKYVRDNPSIPIAPETITFEHYKDVRDSRRTGKYSDEYTALIGYCGSYGGKYFNGGFARGAGRDMFAERVQNLRCQAPNLQGIEFKAADYKEVKEEGCLYYFDPPYRGTSRYVEQTIDYDEFYDHIRELSRKNIVLISEYDMPDDFACIWQKERTVNQQSDRKKADKATEKLFTLNI